MQLEEIRDILLELIKEDKVLVLPVAKDKDNTDYPEPVTPSGIGINDEGTHLLIVTHPVGSEPEFILKEEDKSTLN